MCLFMLFSQVACFSGKLLPSMHRFIPRTVDCIIGGALHTFLGVLLGLLALRLLSLRGLLRLFLCG